MLVVAKGNDGVAEQELGVVPARLVQDRGEVAAGQLNLAAPGRLLQARVLTPPTRRPVALTKLMPVRSVPAWRMRAMTPIRSATSTARPLTSTGLPLDRKMAARSRRWGGIGAGPASRASGGPAIPTPEINTVWLLMPCSQHQRPAPIDCMTNSII
jgi:hypothetical protein